jgi:hypothetical protein
LHVLFFQVKLKTVAFGLEAFPQKSTARTSAPSSRRDCQAACSCSTRSLIAGSCGAGEAVWFRLCMPADHALCTGGGGKCDASSSVQIA